MFKHMNDCVVIANTSSKIKPSRPVVKETPISLSDNEKKT